MYFFTIKFSKVRISELSKQSGLSRDTIRWYEKVGLLKSYLIPRDGNNYRSYNAEALNKLTLIKQSKAFGFSLDEIKELLCLIDNQALDCDAFAPMIHSKLESIQEKIAALKNIENKLITLREQCNGDCQSQLLENKS